VLYERVGARVKPADVSIEVPTDQVGRSTGLPDDLEDFPIPGRFSDVMSPDHDPVTNSRPPDIIARLHQAPPRLDPEGPPNRACMAPLLAPSSRARRSPYRALAGQLKAYSSTLGEAKEHPRQLLGVGCRRPRNLAQVLGMEQRLGALLGKGAGDLASGGHGHPAGRTRRPRGPSCFFAEANTSAPPIFADDRGENGYQLRARAEPILALGAIGALGRRPSKARGVRSCCDRQECPHTAISG